MGRLIREDDVMRMLTSVELNNGTITNAKMELRNVKTAYDVDKVVEELKNKRIEVQKMKNDCIALSDKEVCDIENITYARAIEIVRKGGV